MVLARDIRVKSIGERMTKQVIVSFNPDETVAIKVIDVKMLKGEVHKNLLASEI
jgi:hypothetical protein